AEPRASVVHDGRRTSAVDNQSRSRTRSMCDVTDVSCELPKAGAEIRVAEGKVSNRRARSSRFQVLEMEGPQACDRYVAGFHHSERFGAELMRLAALGERKSPPAKRVLRHRVAHHMRRALRNEPASHGFVEESRGIFRMRPNHA